MTGERRGRGTCSPGERTDGKVRFVRNNGGQYPSKEVGVIDDKNRVRRLAWSAVALFLSPHLYTHGEAEYLSRIQKQHG